MNPDADLERQLEVHLEERARPMPQHVLEASLEAVARTGQARRRAHRAPGWLLRAGATAAVAAAVVLAIVAAPSAIGQLRALFGAGTGSGGELREWDAMLQFREINPAPDGYGHRSVWSWLRSSGPGHDPTTYVPLPTYEETDGMVRWYDPAFDAPGVYIGWPAGDDHLEIQPWGGGEDARAAIVAWRNPEAATGLLIRGTVEVDGSCGDGIDFTLDHAGDEFQSFHVGPGRQSFENVVDLFMAGEILHFIFEPGANSLCDRIRFNVQITTR